MHIKGTPRMGRGAFGLMLIGLLVFAVACGGGGNQATGGSDQAQREQPSGIAAASGNPDQGRTLYAATCTSCHGPGGQGITGLGKNLVTSEFVASQSEAEMVAFLKVGRRANDPANTTGVDMPPKGGNPALSDQDLADIAAYMIELQK